MQPGLIQVLMNVLPGGMEGVASKVLQADGTVDFAGFLQSMLPVLEQQMEGLPADARASLMAELQREIHHAQAVVDVNGAEARALEAMLDPGAGEGDSGSDHPPVIEQLLAMLGDAATYTLQDSAVTGLGNAASGREPLTEGRSQSMQDQLVSTGETVAPAMLMAAGAVLSTPSDEPSFPITDSSALIKTSGQMTLGAAGQIMVSGEQAGSDRLQAVTHPAAGMAAFSGLERQGQAEAMQMAQTDEAPPVQARDVDPSARRGELMTPFESTNASSESASAIPSQLATDPSRPRVEPNLSLLERIPVPVHQQREFGEAVGQRVMLMLGREMQGARIELNPVDLGPMEISLQLRGNEANVHFGAAHALTREVIEAALPRLREMLAEQGFTQVNVNVGQQQGQNAQASNGQGGQSGQSGQGSGTPWGAGQGADTGEASARSVEYQLRSGGVDLFA
jgi:hypothetical protein